MNTNRYYFSNFIEDDDLSILAVKAKEVMQQNDNIVKIFRINNEILYGHSPRQVLYLMKQNNKSIFASSSSNENSPSDKKSEERISTPIRRTSDTSKMPRGSLPLDDAEEKVHHSPTLEFSTPIKRPIAIVQPSVKAHPNPSLDEPGSSAEMTASGIGSTSSPEAGDEESRRAAQIAKMTANLAMTLKKLESPTKVVGSTETCDQDSPRSSQIAKMTSNLAMILKELESPTKVVGSTETSDQDSPRSAQIAKMTANLTMDEKEQESQTKVVGSIETGDQDSPRSAQIAKMTANLTMAEKNLVSPTKDVGSIDVSSQESPCSAKVSMIATSLTRAEKELKSPEKVGGNIKLGNQESPQSAEIPKVTSSPTVDDKESRSLIRDDDIAGNSATNTDSLKPEENVGKSVSPDSTIEYSIGYPEGMKISKPDIIRSETPSPVKRSKISGIPTFVIQKYGNIAENLGSAENSPEDVRANISRIPGDKLNIPPNETVEGIVRDERKRKSLSPRKRHKTFLKSIPRVIQLAGEGEIDIEVTDLDDDSSPKAPRSKSADYRSDSTKDSLKSPVVGGESKTDTSPKTPERYLRPSERTITAGSSRNVTGTRSPGSDDEVSSGIYPSDNLSIVATATGGRSRKFEYSLADIQTDPRLLKAMILKFNTLLSLRDQVVKKAFCSFLSFQSSIDLIRTYVYNTSHILMQLHISEKYSTVEFNETVFHANAVTIKLINKLKLWKNDTDDDVVAWNKCFYQIEQLKAQYEPLLTNQGKPAVSCEIVQVYESEMRAIWRKMDDMIMLGDSRRALFSHIAHDVEQLIKYFVKCLIHVGILQPR